MTFRIAFSEEAEKQLRNLKTNKGLEKRYKAVKKSVRLLAENPRHPSLQTHTYKSLTGPHGEKVYEAYAENKTPAAYRIFFYYGHPKGVLIILSVLSHP